MMAFWCVVLLILWGFLFVAGIGPAYEKFAQTPEDPRGYEVVEYRANVATKRPATAKDMWAERYQYVIGVASFGAVAGIAGFLLVSAVIDYRTSFLGWSIRQLPRLLDRG